MVPEQFIDAGRDARSAPLPNRDRDRRAGRSLQRATAEFTNPGGRRFKSLPPPLEQKARYGGPSAVCAGCSMGPPSRSGNVGGNKRTAHASLTRGGEARRTPRFSAGNREARDLAVTLAAQAQVSVPSHAGLDEAIRDAQQRYGVSDN